MAQLANPLLLALASHMGTGPYPSCSTAHPAPCLWPGKAVQDDPKPWDPALNMRDLEEAPVSWSQIGTALLLWLFGE